MVGNTLVVNGGSASVESAPQRAVHPTTAHETQFREIFQALAEGLPPPVTGDDARETLRRLSRCRVDPNGWLRRFRPNQVFYVRVMPGRLITSEYPGASFIDGDELDAVTRVVRSRSFSLLGFGQPDEVTEYEREWAAHVGVRHALAVELRYVGALLRACRRGRATW